MKLKLCVKNKNMEIELLMPFMQLIIASILGALLGTERALAGKNAGMRTFSLVSMGSALFVIISVIISESFLGITNFDPLRTSAAIITGIGFIGAGLIFFSDEKGLRGLTTAAGLWVSCGIGIAIGFELYLLAFFATIITLFNFAILWFVEEKIKKQSKK